MESGDNARQFGRTAVRKCDNTATGRMKKVNIWQRDAEEQ
jgi:hypothetical protein